MARRDATEDLYRRMKSEMEPGTTCADHTPCPDTYIRWQSWADGMSQTHQQRQVVKSCPCNSA